MAEQGYTGTARSEVVLAVLREGARAESSPECRGESGIVQYAGERNVLGQCSCGLLEGGQECLQLSGRSGEMKEIR